MKGIDGGYKSSELLSGRGGSADVVVFEVKFSLGWPNFVPFTQLFPLCFFPFEVFSKRTNAPRMLCRTFSGVKGLGIHWVLLL